MPCCIEMIFTPRNVLFFLLLVLMAGCGKNNVEQTVTILVSGDTAGWIVPCGCTSNQSGGLPRRGTLVEQHRQQGPVIVVEVGGASSGNTLYDKLKFEAILQGETVMGIAAHNIGHAEAMMGIKELHRLQETWKTPWISANTTDAAGNPLVESTQLVELGKRKILFVGVLSQKYQTEEIQVTAPRQAVLKTLQKNAGNYDHAVVLAYVPEDELRELAENLPEVDAVVGGPTGQPVPPDYPQGFVLMVSATKQGKFVAALTLPATQENHSRIRGEIIELNERFADDPAQLENVKNFYATLKQHDLSPKDTPFVDRNDFLSMPNTMQPIAGSKACQTCHEEEYRIWKNSRHAVAWQSLVHREAQYDSDCQRCHVTGYGQPGGFETIAGLSERFNVGCESCHSGAAEHCKKDSIRPAFVQLAKERCVKCHDRENSPKFDLDVYWEKIRHDIVADDSVETDNN